MPFSSHNPFGVLSDHDDDISSDCDSSCAIDNTTHPSSTPNIDNFENNDSNPVASPPGSSDGSADMAPGKKPSLTPRREVDLSSTLTVIDKLELISLATKITEYMLLQQCNSFDAVDDQDENQFPRPSFWGKLPAHLLDRSFSMTAPNGQDVPNSLRLKNNQSGRHCKEESHPLGTRRPAPQPTESAIPPLTLTSTTVSPGPILQELKKEYTAHFRKWQGNVIRRLNEIIVQAPRSTVRGRGPRMAPPNGGFTGLSAAPKTCMTEADEKMRKFYPPVSNSLSYHPMEKKKLILHATLLLLISLESYQAYSRSFMIFFTSSLHVPIHVLLDDEIRLARALADAIKDLDPVDLAQQKSNEAKAAKRSRGATTTAVKPPCSTSNNLSRALMSAKIGMLESGMAIGTVATANALATVAETPTVVATLFGLCLGRVSGKPVEQLVREIPDFSLRPTFDLENGNTQFGRIRYERRRFRVVLALGGWLMNNTVAKPWHAMGPQSETYALQWDPEALRRMGKALETLAKSASWSMAKRELALQANQTEGKKVRPPSLGSITSLMKMRSGETAWPSGLLKMSKTIDNPWTMGMVRADKTGQTLADILMAKAQGERGVSLIGYSLGARVIYTCLMCLSERRAFGLVENAILMGTPAPSSPIVWTALKSVVSTRLVNVYSEHDYILGFLYRMSNIECGVSGLQRIEGVIGIENVDVTAKIGGHTRYPHLVGSILAHIGWEGIDKQVVAADEAALLAAEKQWGERAARRDAVELNLGSKETAEEPEKAPVSAVQEPDGIIRTRVRRKKKTSGRR